MKISRKALVGLLGATTALAASGIAIGAAGDDDYSAALAGKINPAKPKNVILLVGDGMGDSEVTLARYYAKGAAGRLNMDRLPFRGSSIHYVLSPGPGPTYQPNYVGDSAPTATAWSTGKRTQDGRLSQGPSSANTVPGSNEGYKTYLEIAKERGKATGNVSTAEITDATPAAPSSHISQRACQGPADTRTTCASEAKTATPAGLGSIAEQQVDNGFDVVLGGGADRYGQTLEAGGTDTVIDYAEANGYDVINTKQQLAAVNDLSAGKVLGLFTGANMTTEYKPLFARTAAYYTANPGRDVTVDGGSPTTRCQPQSRGNEPSLSEMTKKAIQLLEDDSDGFTLQVEGASIDKRDHAADVCGQIGETVAFDDAIGVALDYQESHPDTLVVVTADHAHTSQMTYSTSPPAAGTSFATLQTVDGAPIRVSYGTADTGNAIGTTGGSQHHTGAQVPLWSGGPQAANLQGTHDQTDIFRVLNGLTPSALGGYPGPKGDPGTNGVNGSNGTNGVAGPGGPQGNPGNNGANGSSGPAGVQGPSGRDGRDASVTCKTSSKNRLSCTISRTAAKASSARLVKNKKTVATGKVSKAGRVTFTARKTLAKGKYTVVVGTAKYALSIK
jgi:alkaline phosphatase